GSARARGFSAWAAACRARVTRRLLRARRGVAPRCRAACLVHRTAAAAVNRARGGSSAASEAPGSTWPGTVLVLNLHLLVRTTVVAHLLTESQRTIVAHVRLSST